MEVVFETGGWAIHRRVTPRWWFFLDGNALDENTTSLFYRRYNRVAGDPGMERFIFVDLWIVERLSLRHSSGKYREAEGAPGSCFEPGSWG